MKILVIGGGGREHALAWKLAQSPRATRVYVAPGNAGTAAHGGKLENVAITDLRELREWAQTHAIALTVVGPEAPLAEGVVDSFRAHGLCIFGPTQAAAQLESSKAFSKAFMRRHRIPTADYDTFTEATVAHAFIDRLGAPIVVKADGLAAGKGVVVAMTAEQAHAAVDTMLDREGARVVIEQFLEGEEASFIVLTDGKYATPLAASQDHKRLHDGDLGPNTGGMGAYSPAPLVTADVHARAMREVIRPAIRGMEKEGITYTGFLYAGLMVDGKGQLKVLEFNCRMGDPETQPILMRLKSDLLEVLLAATDGKGKLEHVELQWDRRAALGIVMAAHGYPETPRTGDAIVGLPANNDEVMVFHAATSCDVDGVLRTNGGRVLCVTALAESLRQAQQRAYSSVRDIRFEGAQYRSDIGHKAIK